MLAWLKQLNRYAGNQPRDCIKFPRALLSIKQIVHVCILDQPNGGSLGGDLFDSRSLWRLAARLHDVNARHRPVLRFKLGRISFKIQELLLPIGGYFRELGRRSKELSNRVRPQVDAWVAGSHLKLAFAFANGGNVLAQNRNAAHRQRRRCCRFANACPTTKRKSTSVDAKAAGVQRQYSPAAQHKPHDRTEKVGGQVLGSKRRRTATPNSFRLAIRHNLGAVGIAQPKKFLSS